MKLLAFCLIVFSCNRVVSQDPVYQLEGVWKVEDKQQFESWELVDAILTGEGFKIKEEQKIITETLLISKESGEWIYSATVPNQNNGQAIPFSLNKNETEKLSFENLNHDFPKKIQYQFLNESEVLVNVLGEGDRGFNFKMIKQD